MCVYVYARGGGEEMSLFSFPVCEEKEEGA